MSSLNVGFWNFKTHLIYIIVNYSDYILKFLLKKALISYVYVNAAIMKHK